MTEPLENGEPNDWPEVERADSPLEPLSVKPLEEETIPQVLPVKRGHPILAWVVIGVAVVAVSFLRGLRATEDQQAAQADRTAMLMIKLQGRLSVGFNEILKATDPNSGKSLVSQVYPLAEKGSLDERLCYFVLIGELAGFEKASQMLRDLDDKIAASDHVQDTNALLAKDTLERLYADYGVGKFGSPSVSQEERANLRATLGWFGDLALAPREGNSETRQKLTTSAQALALICACIFGLMLFVGFAGLVGLIALVSFHLSGKLKHGVLLGGGQGGIYAETFALWMVAYPLFSFAAFFIHLKAAELLVPSAAFLASLIVLAWPVVRGGIPWQQVRKDIGLVAGRQPILEPLLGPVGNAVSLPLLVVAGILILILISLQGAWGSMWGTVIPADDFRPIEVPSHPIIPIMIGAGWWVKAQLFFLGCVVAPFVEEIMFRGVLYRHMRESTRRWSFFLSFVTSALVVSFVFGIVHPQGLIAVPGLMALATGFTIMREWRGSLISCMVAHGLNNAVVFSLSIFMFSS